MNRLTILKKLLYILIIALSASCARTPSIKSGDIVFRGAISSDLSEAINEVTQTSNATNYTHIGLCDVVDGKVIVYHADLGKGVVSEPIALFLRSEDTVSYHVDLYRIKNRPTKQIEKAVSLAKSLVGNPYNTTYILEDKGFYCSEYIYELFKRDSVFKLEPMTFKNPETNEFHEGWIKHYENLGIDIPEGKLGCNPNGMAISDALKFIKKIQ
jgi:hypothetical protein